MSAFKKSSERMASLSKALLHRCILNVPYMKGEESYQVKFGGGFGSPQVQMGLTWSENGLHIHLDSKLGQPLWPNYWDGDAVELYVATKNWKESRSIHRFCHLFAVLPEPINGVYSAEVTELSQLEMRSLAKENCLSVKKSKKGIIITLPFENLYGWDEDEKRMGFACAVYQQSGPPAWWPGDGRPLERLPSLWAELILGEA